MIRSDTKDCSAPWPWVAWGVAPWWLLAIAASQACDHRDARGRAGTAMPFRRGRDASGRAGNRPRSHEDARSGANTQVNSTRGAG